MNDDRAATATTLILRTCPSDMVATGTYRDEKTGETRTYSMPWPRSGPVVCPDWDPRPVCGHGLHGLAWGEGDWGLLSSDADAVWMVVEVQTSDIVAIDKNKVKFPRGVVIFAGSRAEAIALIMCGQKRMAWVRAEAERWQKENPNSSTAASSGDYSKAASSGDYSKAASSGYSSTAASSGYSSTAASSGYSSTAASSGDYSTAASSGDYSKAASSGDYSTAASSGYYSKAASSGYYSKAASSGDYSKAEQKGASGIATSIGNGGMAKAGENGLLIVTYWNEKEKRYRACIGNVGEDGVIADTWYRVEDGRLVVAK